jgi:hypothetical protein
MLWTKNTKMIVYTGKQGVIEFYKAYMDASNNIDVLEIIKDIEANWDEGLYIIGDPDRNDEKFIYKIEKV